MGPSCPLGQPIRTQDSLHLARSRSQPYNNRQYCKVWSSAGSRQDSRKNSEKAKAKIISDNGELNALQKQVDAFNKAIHRDRGLIAGGFLVTWLAAAGGIDLHKREAKKNVQLQIVIKVQQLMALNAA